MTCLTVEWLFRVKFQKFIANDTRFIPPPSPALVVRKVSKKKEKGSENCEDKKEILYSAYINNSHVCRHHWSIGFFYR